MKTVLAIIAVLGLATIAQAGVTVVVDNPVDLGGGLQSILVHLVADCEADMVTAWDGSFNGPMNQIGAFGGALPTPTLTNVGYLTPAEAAADTHFMLADTELLVARLPNESPILLDGAFGIVPESVGLDLVLAQIVTAVGETVTMSGQAANATGETFDLLMFPPYGSPPVADADGPYTIDVGETLTLDASGSWDDDDDIDSYRWDLDGDWVYETDAGGQPVFSVDYAYLESLGLGVCDPFDPYDIHLKVTDIYYSFDTDDSTLTIIPEPVTLSFLVMGGLALIRRRRK